ncbi:MAG: putative peptidoglycan glycosyltransferase FtsW [Victivallaceae bacterium]
MQNIYIPENSIDLKDDLSAHKSLNYAYGMIVTVTAIVLFGLTMLYSTSYGTAGTKFFYSQLLWAFVGILCASAVFIIGHKRMGDYSILFIFGVVLLLLIADFCFPAIKGAHRWIRFRAGIQWSIQPSEFAKIAVALYLSKYCSENMRYLNDFLLRRGPIIPIIVTCMVMGGVAAGKDLGTTLLLATVTWTVFFVAGMRLLILLPPVLLGAPGLFILIKNFDPERLSRLTTFLNPEICQKTDGYQLWNSLLALGSGKWFGVGFMESRLKAKYLPEAHTDFILSIVGEELGLISLCGVILAYMFFAYFALRISLNSRSRQGMLLGIALTATITFQAIINIGVVSGGFPTKGMPAPFISYGGSNLLMSLIAVGLLLNIAVETASPGFNDEILAAIRAKIPFLRKGK